MTSSRDGLDCLVTVIKSFAELVISGFVVIDVSRFKFIFLESLPHKSGVSK